MILHKEYLWNARNADQMMLRNTVQSHVGVTKTFVWDNDVVRMNLIVTLNVTIVRKQE